MRLGAYPCEITSGYASWPRPTASEMISERHRHRYEFNNNFREEIENKGMHDHGHLADRRACGDR